LTLVPSRRASTRPAISSDFASSFGCSYPDTDRWVFERGYISMTPLRLDLTDEEQLAQAKKLAVAAGNYAKFVQPALEGAVPKRRTS
jgi:hypothetical protein